MARRGRKPCCIKSEVKRGPWSPDEDFLLIAFLQGKEPSNWRTVPKLAGLQRCGKSCRLRWINYLRPDVKRGNFSKEEEDTIIRLHEAMGNKWSAIASHLPGRTDNEIKNVWNTRLKKISLKKASEDTEIIVIDDDEPREASQNPPFFNQFCSSNMDMRKMPMSSIDPQFDEAMAELDVNFFADFEDEVSKFLRDVSQPLHTKTTQRNVLLEDLLDPKSDIWETNNEDMEPRELPQETDKVAAPQTVEEDAITEWMAALEKELDAVDDVPEQTSSENEMNKWRSILVGDDQEDNLRSKDALFDDYEWLLNLEVDQDLGCLYTLPSSSTETTNNKQPPQE